MRSPLPGWTMPGRWPPRRHRPRNPLAQHYASGTTLAHYSTDQVTRDGSGSVTAFGNLGGAGPALNAVVSGPALTQQGATVIIPGGTSYIETPLALDLVGVRLMWLMDGAQIVHGTRLFGHAGEPATFVSVTQNETGRTLVLTYSGQPGLPLTPRVHWATGLALYELEVTQAEQRFWINGSLIANRVGALSAAAFPVSRLGVGNVGTLPFSGRLGEIIAPILGRPDTAGAITAARARLEAKRDIG